MKDLIIQALTDAITTLDKHVPMTKQIGKSISILDVSPIDLLSFMKDNNIPDDADFDGRENGYDAWDDILLSWTISVPTNDADKIKYKRRIFNSHAAFRSVYKLLTSSGYKRIGSSSALFKAYDDTTVYDMFIDKDFDRLISYYSLSFTKV